MFYFHVNCRNGNIRTTLFFALSSEIFWSSLVCLFCFSMETGASDHGVYLWRSAPPHCHCCRRVVSQVCSTTSSSPLPPCSPLSFQRSLKMITPQKRRLHEYELLVPNPVITNSMAWTDVLMVKLALLVSLWSSGLQGKAARRRQGRTRTQRHTTATPLPRHRW